MLIYKKFKTISLKNIIDLFAPIFMLFHNWNIDDEKRKVEESKRLYIKNEILSAISKEKISGTIKEYYNYESDSLCINFNETSVDMKQAIGYLFDKICMNEVDMMYTIVKNDLVRSSSDDNSRRIAKNKPIDYNKSSIIDNIEPIISALIYCIMNNQDVSITKEDLTNHLISEGFKKIDHNYIYSIIPEPYRHPSKGGPPKKIIDKAIAYAFESGFEYKKNDKIKIVELQNMISNRFGDNCRTDVFTKIFTYIEMRGREITKQPDVTPGNQS